MAHSHGGNVAAHAVWRLLPATSRIPAVALATPFLFAKRRRVEPAVVAAAVVAVLVLTLLAPFAVWAVAAEDAWGASRVVLLFVCVLLVLPALVQLVSVVAWRRVHGHLRSEDDRQAMVDRVQVPSCDDSLLVVRAPDDEAGAGLALVQLAGLFSTRSAGDRASGRVAAARRRALRRRGGRRPGLRPGGERRSGARGWPSR